MKKNPYETPKVFELGAIKELTRSTPEPDKCSGSGEVLTDNQGNEHVLSELFSGDCP